MADNLKKNAGFTIEQLQRKVCYFTMHRPLIETDFYFLRLRVSCASVFTYVYLENANYCVFLV